MAKAALKPATHTFLQQVLSCSVTEQTTAQPLPRTKQSAFVLRQNYSTNCTAAPAGGWRCGHYHTGTGKKNTFPPSLAPLPSPCRRAPSCRRRGAPRSALRLAPGARAAPPSGGQRASGAEGRGGAPSRSHATLVWGWSRGLPGGE